MAELRYQCFAYRTVGGPAYGAGQSYDSLEKAIIDAEHTKSPYVMIAQIGGNYFHVVKWIHHPELKQQE